MFRLGNFLWTLQAISYFQKEYTLGDFYLSANQDGEDGESLNKIKGKWFGQGAIMLGLSGHITSEDFTVLMQGKSPDGTQLVRHRDGKHRAALDGTFSAGKSISVLALVGGDERLIELHNRAVEAGRREIERLALARTADKNVNRLTGNLIIAGFQHYESRALEPQLHDHTLIVNATFDELARNKGSDRQGAWRALQSDDIYKAQKLITEVYRVEIARGLRELGYQFHIDEHGAPQINGVPKTVLDTFSSRSAEIDKKLDEEKTRAATEGRKLSGKELAALAEEITRQTREAKHSDINPQQLQAEWKQAALKHQFDVEAFVSRARQASLAISEQEKQQWRKESHQAAREAVGHAIEVLTERNSVFTEKELELRVLRDYRHAGKFSIVDVRAEINSLTHSGELIRKYDSEKNRALFTTKEMQIIERQTLGLASAGAGKASAISSPEEANQTATKVDEQGRSLNEEQREVFNFLATNKDMVLSVSGKAGVGKSFVFGKFAQFAEAQGYGIQAFGPTITATDNLRKDGLDARTLQSHLLSKPVSDERPKIWLVDEAGMIGIRDMNALLRKAQLEGARVILAGDVRQYSSVPAGRSYNQLLEAGIANIDLNRITRQDKAPEEVRKAILDFSDGKVIDGMSKLHQANRVIELAKPEDRYKKIAALYVEQQGETLVVCPTNKERNQANSAIREALIEKGLVAEEGLETEIYVNTNITKAERKEVRNYQAGSMIRFAKVRHRSFEEGQWYKVVANDLGKNTVTVLTPKGKQVTYNPGEHYGIEDVYRVEKRTFSVGDKIQLRATDKLRGYKSGEVAEIIAIKDGVAILQNKAGEILAVDLKQYKTVDYAYVSTGHSSQGRTVDNAIFLATSKHREEVINLAAAYVSTSRTRGQLYVVVDEYQKSVEAMQRKYVKDAALDLDDRYRARINSMALLKRKVIIRDNQPGPMDDKNYNKLISNSSPAITVKVKIPIEFQLRHQQTISMREPGSGVERAPELQNNNAVKNGSLDNRPGAVKVSNLGNETGHMVGQPPVQIKAPAEKQMSIKERLIDAGKKTVQAIPPMEANSQKFRESVAAAWNLRASELRSGKSTDQSDALFKDLFGKHWHNDKPGCLNQAKDIANGMAIDNSQANKIISQAGGSKKTFFAIEID